MDSTLTIDRVPAFRAEPLITWGPPPDGVAHAERVPVYDLQHQVTTVRFDWPRHAVVGTTTLTIAGLEGAAPLSSLSIDAGDMTFSRVASGNTALKYDYDGRALTVHLASPLRSGQKTSITIDYDGAESHEGRVLQARQAHRLDPGRNRRQPLLGPDLRFSQRQGDVGVLHLDGEGRARALQRTAGRLTRSRRQH